MTTHGDLLEGPVYLEPGKPTLVGVTNLKWALILVLKLVPVSPAK
jgi:hypothetical protein